MSRLPHSLFFFFFNDTATTEIYTLSLHDALPLDDLMYVLDHAGDGLMLVDDAVEAECPDGRAPQRRQQHAAQRIAEGVAVAPLERLEAELGGVRVVFPLGHLDQVRADQPGQIKSRDHLE